MATFLLRRAAWSIVVLLAVATFTFLLTQVAPADPARSIAGRNASAEAVEAVRRALGLDRPVPEQLVGYLGRAVQGDLGRSFRKDEPVLDLILARAPATAQLAVGGLLVGLAIGIPLGIRSALRPGGWIDRVGVVLTSMLVAAPAFWIGALLLYVLAFQAAVVLDVRVFPNGGYEPLSLRHLALPSVTLGLGLAAAYLRLTRTMLLDELSQDYIRTARAKGAGERRVALRHGFRNAFPVLLTQIGLDLGLLLGGIVVVESVFSFNGVGKLALDAIESEDLPLLMGTVLFATTCVVVANLLVDLASAWFDPRIRAA